MVAGAQAAGGEPVIGLAAVAVTDADQQLAQGTQGGRTSMSRWSSQALTSVIG